MARANSLSRARVSKPTNSYKFQINSASLPRVRLKKYLMLFSSVLNLNPLCCFMGLRCVGQGLRLLLVSMAAAYCAGCASQGSYNAQTNDFTDQKPLLVITSPRHARTFDVSGNNKLSQDLRWNSETQSLTAVVSYSLITGEGDADFDPANYRVIELPFPSVKLDKDSNLFVWDPRNQKVVIGHLEGGVFGARVVLNENVRLSAHRRAQELSGKLIVSAP
jgi:hypothetical protein